MRADLDTYYVLFGAPRSFSDTEKLQARLIVFAHEHRMKFYQIDMQTNERWTSIEACFHGIPADYSRKNIAEDLRALCFDDLILNNIHTEGARAYV